METHLHFTLAPITTKKDRKELENKYWNIFLGCHGTRDITMQRVSSSHVRSSPFVVAELTDSDFSPAVKNFIVASRMTFTLTQSDSIALTINNSENKARAVLIGTRNTAKAVATLIPEFAKEKNLKKAHPIEFITVPMRGEQLPWEMMAHNYDAILSFTSAFELVFTRLSENMFKFMLFMLFGREPGKKAVIIIEKVNFLARSFLKERCGFTEVHRGGDFGLLEIVNTPEHDEEEDAMETA